MRRALLFCVAIAFAIACGDSLTEPMPDRTVATPPIAFATTTTEDGLSISTDKDDYQPGDTVHFTGSGWQPGDVLDIVLTDEPLTHEPHTWSVEVGSDGMFHDSTYVVDEGDLNVAFTLVATSRATGRSLTVNFTDSQPQTVTLTPTPQSVAQGSPGVATYTVSVTQNGSATACTMTLSVPGLPAGVSATFTGGLSTFTTTTNANFSTQLTINTTAAVPTSTITITVQVARVDNCQGSGSTPGTGTLNVIGPAAKLAFVQQPTSTTGGATITPSVTVQVLDVADHPVSSSASIALAIGTNPASGTLSGIPTQAAVNGLATFPGLSVNKAGNGYTLTANSSGLTGATSNVFNITVGPFAKLGFTTQPGGGSAGIAFPAPQQPVVAAQDAGGNTITTGQGSTASITLTIQTNPSSGTLTCTTNPLGATNGVAAFGGCRINNAGNGYQLRASNTTSGTTRTVDSDLFNIAASNAAPNAPAALAQFRSDATTTIATAGFTNETSVVLRASVSDPDAGNTVKLQVEVKPVGTAFTNVASAESGLLSSGSTASATVTGLTNGTSYHWQARAVDNSGAGSSWTSFGGNAEAAADFSVDTDAPGVTINQAGSPQADPTHTSPINFTVAFNKPVSGFATGDVTLTGTAGATTATVSPIGPGGLNYNVAVSGMTTDGTVIASIGAGVVSDAAGNDNVASTSTDNEVTYDTAKPTVTINQAATQADPTNASTINFTVEFNEIVTGFATGDVALSGTAGATTATVSGSGATYNIAVTGMTTDGTVIASIVAGVATDAADNANVVSTSTDHTVTYDNTPPTVTINQAAGQADPTKVSPINFTVVFNETVTDFATGDVTLSGTAGAATATVTGSGTTYNVAVSGMTSNGTVIASITAAKAHDAAGNGNSASTSTDHTITYDPEPPAVSDVAVNPSLTNGTIAVTATAKVDDAATGNSTIVAAEYSIDGDTPVAMDPSDGHFDSATENVTALIPLSVVSALSKGDHQVCVRGKDAAGNMSAFTDTGACATLRIDPEPPVVSNVLVNPNPTNGTINVTATAHVTDATTGNSKITSAYYKIDTALEVGMDASDTHFDEATENVTATIPAATVLALSEGDHQVCVRGKDAAGNSSSFSDVGACATLTIDKTPPKVTVNQKSGQADPTKVSPINFTVVFDETVTDFATGDVTLSGAAGATTATVSGSGMTYYVAVSGMTGDGTVIASIASGVAHDAAGNGNEASTSTDNSVVYDKTPPVISCGAADLVWHGANVSIACTASDATSGLADAGDASFNLETSVAAGVETDDAATNSRSIADAAGNSATAGPVSGNKVDIKAPTFSCGTPDGNWHADNVSIACTASDGGSGVAPASDASFSLHTSVAAGTETANASTDSKTIKDAVNNSVIAGPISGNRVDKKGPVVALTCPLTPVILGAPASASWTATDGGSGVAPGLASGNIALQTSSVGSKTATAPVGTSKDNVNNDSAPQVTCDYSVAYNFTGLFAPVDRPNTMNLSKAGQAVPLKWRLTDNNGAPVLNFTAAALGVAVTGMVCTVNAALDQIEEYAGASGLQNLGDGYYQFNWKTPTSYANSCKSIGLNLGEGTPRGPLAYFNFKK